MNLHSYNNNKAFASSPQRPPEEYQDCWGSWGLWEFSCLQLSCMVSSGQANTELRIQLALPGSWKLARRCPFQPLEQIPGKPNSRGHCDCSGLLDQYLVSMALGMYYYVYKYVAIRFQWPMTEIRNFFFKGFFFFWFVFHFMYMGALPECQSVYRCAVPTETRKGGQIHWDGDRWVVGHYVDSRNWWWSLWKSSQYSERLSHLSSPPVFFFMPPNTTHTHTAYEIKWWHVLSNLGETHSPSIS